MTGVQTCALPICLAPDFQERSDSLEFGTSAVSTEFSPPQRVLAVQRALLNHLMSDAVAVRILDNQGAARGSESFQLAELYTRLDRDIWSELRGGSDIPAARRELQREHLNRLAALLLRPSTPATRADSRGLVRAEASDLLARIKGAQSRSALSADARAHLKDCDETLTQALSARLVRAGV